MKIWRLSLLKRFTVSMFMWRRQKGRQRNSLVRSIRRENLSLSQNLSFFPFLRPQHKPTSPPPPFFHKNLVHHSFIDLCFFPSNIALQAFSIQSRIDLLSTLLAFTWIVTNLLIESFEDITVSPSPHTDSGYITHFDLFSIPRSLSYFFFNPNRTNLPSTLAVSSLGIINTGSSTSHRVFWRYIHLVVSSYLDTSTKGSSKDLAPILESSKLSLIIYLSSKTLKTFSPCLLPTLITSNTPT